MTLDLNALGLNPHLLRQAAFIGGNWIEGEGLARQAIRNPSTGGLVGEVPVLGAEHARLAIAAARAAQGPWAQRPAKERAAFLTRWAAAMLDAREDLARILTAEQGKPLHEARGEIDYAASYVSWYAAEAERVLGETLPSPDPAKRILVLRQPIGVCAAITPWNFPAAMITRKVAPALAAGCTMIVKPAPATPFTALAMAQLAQDCGLPAGVLSIVVGDAVAIGHELVASPVVRKLSFTGSTPVGKMLLAGAAQTVKKCSMELGGNAPFIVFDDADLDTAVQGLMLAKFRNAGQTCICPNRIFVQSGIADAFRDKLVVAVAALEVADGFAPRCDIGPLIDSAAVAKVERLVADALAKGAVPVFGATRHALGGNYYTPTVLDHVTPDMAIAEEEIFGPVACLIRFDDEGEVIAMANAGETGLSAYFYSRGYSRIVRVSEALEAGMVGVNDSAISLASAPFGGIKQSGLGREGSRHGMDDYLELKYISIGGLNT